MIAHFVQRAPSLPGRSWGFPDYLNSNNGSKSTANHVRKSLHKFGVIPMYFEPGYPWDHGYFQSFNGKPRNAISNQLVVYTFEKAKILVNTSRNEYDESSAPQGRTKWVGCGEVNATAVC